jgi:hypothetical protein
MYKSTLFTRDCGRMRSRLSFLRSATILVPSSCIILPHYTLASEIRQIQQTLSKRK